MFQLADVRSLPGVRELVRLRPGEGDHHLALAHWILSSKCFAVKTLQKDEVHNYDLITQTTDYTCLQSAPLTMCFFHLHQYGKLCNLTENGGVAAPVPDFLFELEYCEQMNARFERMREGRDLFYAFHGSRLENFHSIIHNGLHCHLNKVPIVVCTSRVLW